MSLCVAVGLIYFTVDAKKACAYIRNCAHAFKIDFHSSDSTATRSNANYELIDYSKITNKKLHHLTNADLNHGMKQVDEMMKDLPRMSDYVSKGDPIYLWSARQFAGEHTGVHFFWKPNMVSGELKACNSPREALISVSSNYYGLVRDGEELWSHAVFELHNIRGLPFFDEIHNGAVAGTISEKDYIRIAANVEFEAVQATKRFYRDVWLPHLESRKIEPAQSSWFEDFPSDFRTAFSSYREDDEYPYGCYGRSYRNLREQGMRANNKAVSSSRQAQQN